MKMEDALRKINKVGEDFGKLMSCLPNNYCNGYMQAIRDCKAQFYGDVHIVESDKMVVKNEEIQRMINTCIKDKCWYGECDGCTFFEPKDTTDGEYFCSIRDKNGNVPFYEKWDMKDALTKEKV